MHIVVVGGGPAGYEGALHAAKEGARVTLVEKNRVGGTCLQVGCIPTKALLASGEVLHTLQNAKEYGLVSSGTSAPDWGVVQARKEQIVAQLTAGVERALQAAGVETLRGTARLLPNGRVEVQHGEGGASTLAADGILLATGSSPLLPGFLAGGGKNVLTSDELLGLPALPASALVAGGGVMGCEFAQLLARLNCEATVIELLPHLLPAEDEDVGRALERGFRRERIRAVCGQGIARVETTADGVQAVLANGKALQAQVLVAALGRRPNTENLNLGAVGLVLDDGGFLPADEHMRTAAPGIWAAGDILRSPQLAHVAAREALVAVDDMLGKEAQMDYRAVPRCAYTEPEAACVGATQKELAAAGIPYKTGRFEMPGNGRARTMGKTGGFVKILLDERNILLGAAVVCAGAAEMLPLLALGVQRRLTAQDLAAVIFPHPSLSEAIREALLAAAQAPLS